MIDSNKQENDSDKQEIDSGEVDNVIQEKSNTSILKDDYIIQEPFVKETLQILRDKLINDDSRKINLRSELADR